MRAVKDWGSTTPLITVETNSKPRARISTVTEVCDPHQHLGRSLTAERGKTPTLKGEIVRAVKRDVRFAVRVNAFKDRAVDVRDGLEASLDVIPPGLNTVDNAVAVPQLYTDGHFSSDRSCPGTL